MLSIGSSGKVGSDRSKPHSNIEGEPSVANAQTGFMSIKEAAERLGLTNSDVDDLCEAGVIESQPKRLVRRESVEAYADSLSESEPS